MSESTILTQLQTLIRNASRFESDMVRVNDDTQLDGPAERTITVLTSDELESDFALGSADVIYTVYLMLYEPFSDDWETSMNAFTTSRDAIIATLQDYDTTDGIIESFRADTPVGGVYYDESLDGTGVPVYIAQRLAVTIREYDE